MSATRPFGSRRTVWGFSGWFGADAAATILRRKEIDMEHDILIAGSMALATVLIALGLVWRLARAVREGPEPVTPAGMGSALRPTQGW